MPLDTHLISSLLDAMFATPQVLMFVNVSPLARHHSESTSSLRFASKAGGVDVGPAEKRVRTG